MVVWQGGMTKNGWTMVLHDGEIRARPQPMTRQYWSWIFTSWDRLIWFDWENRLSSIGDPDQLLLIVDWLLEVWIFSTHCWLSEWHFSYESLCNFDLVFEVASVSNMSNDGGRGVRQEQACGCVNANAKEVATVQSSADLRPQAPCLETGSITSGWGLNYLFEILPLSCNWKCSVAEEGESRGLVRRHRWRERTVAQLSSDQEKVLDWNHLHVVFTGNAHSPVWRNRMSSAIVEKVFHSHYDTSCPDPNPLWWPIS